MHRSLAIFGLTLALLGGQHLQAIAADSQLSHAVYFTLKDGTAQNKESLVRGCQEFLKGHGGEVSFSVGVLVEDLDRSVNDRDFDVSLVVVFENRAAHDVYQTHPRHLKFIEKYKDLWKSVRVFDSYLAKDASKQ